MLLLNRTGQNGTQKDFEKSIDPPVLKLNKFKIPLIFLQTLVTSFPLQV